MIPASAIVADLERLTPTWEEMSGSQPCSCSLTETALLLADAAWEC